MILKYIFEIVICRSGDPAEFSSLATAAALQAIRASIRLSRNKNVGNPFTFASSISLIAAITSPT